MLKLAAALGAKPPAEFSQLAPAERDDLSAAVTAAGRRRSDDLDAAIEAGLKHLPWGLRGTVKKALGL